jgi:hypothetical protein
MDLYQPGVVPNDLRFEMVELDYNVKLDWTNTKLEPVGKIAIWKKNDEFIYELIEMRKLTQGINTVPLYLDIKLHPVMRGLLGQTVRLQGQIAIKHYNNVPNKGVFRLYNSDLLQKIIVAVAFSR